MSPEENHQPMNKFKIKAEKKKESPPLYTTTTTTITERLSKKSWRGVGEIKQNKTKKSVWRSGYDRLLFDYNNNDDDGGC